MTDRNELERLLAAATEGPWEPEYDPIGDSDEHATAICLPGFAGQIGTFIAYCQHNWNDAYAGEHRISWKEATSNAALICFLRNNAQHYLSLMDEVERLREALGRIASCDLLEVERYYERHWCIPETGNEYTSREPVFKRSSYQNAEEFQAIARQALGETHDN